MMGFAYLTKLFTRSEVAPPTLEQPALGPRYSPRNGFPTSRLVGGLDAARVDRFAESWVGTPVTPDEWVRLWLRILQARSRDMSMNDPYMRRFVRACRANIVGHGPKLRCMAKLTNGKDDAKTNTAVVQSWHEWSEAENCDVTGRQTLPNFTLSVVTSLAVDGEAFVKIVSGGTFGIQLQHLDSVRCPSDYDVEDTGHGTYIRSGIEFDISDRPVAYYFTADPQHGNYYDFAGRSFQRVRADEVIHVFRHEMAGQKRGFPWATSSLFRLKRLKGFEDNAAMNAEVGAGKMGIISWEDGAGPEAPENEEIRITAEGGTFVELPSGARLDKWDPSFPDDAVASFTKSLLRAAGSGMGINYPTLGNDLEGVNFSSIRSGTLEERELWKEDQKLLIEQFLRPVFRLWLPEALLRGLVMNDTGYTVPATKRQVISRTATFHPRRWEWVDPKSDATANRMAMTTLTKSPQEVIRERGHDPNDVLDEIALWYKTAAEKGIPAEAMQTAWGDVVKAAVNDNPPAPSAKENDNDSNN